MVFLGYNQISGAKIMNVSVLSKIENNISQLSLTEQLWLIERLIQRIRESTLDEQSILESQLTAMAADPEIQNELQLK